jgi:hypothetical protein
MTRLKNKIVAAPVAAVGVAGLVLAGGVAVAATSGAIDVPFDGHDNRSDRAPEAPSSTNPGLDRTDQPTPGAPRPTEGPGSTEGPQGTPAPSLRGLCKAFQAGALKDGKNSPAFNALVAAAGGTENLTTYCVDLVGPAKKPTHPAKPTKPAKPTQAASPTKPPQAGQPASPTKPAKPTQAASPTLPSQAATPEKPAAAH